MLTSHVEANLTREFHGLTDEHLDNHTAAGSTHDLVHLYNSGLADSSWFGTAEPPEMKPVADSTGSSIPPRVDRRDGGARRHL